MRNPRQHKLCLAFQNLAFRTWERMRINSYSPIQVSEEAITSINLQDLFNSSIYKLLVVDFTHFQESNLTGADWEWWFLQNGFAFGAAVQAKKLKPDRTYDISYTPANGNPQIRMLLDYCLSKGDVSPMYCFYNYWEEYEIPELVSIPYFASFPSWGCSLAHGIAIWQLYNQNRNTLLDIVPVSVPWHYFVCYDAEPSVHYPMGPATRAADMLANLRTMDPGIGDFYIEDDPYANFQDSQLRRQPPDRIRTILNLRREGLPINRALIRELWGDQIPRHLFIYGAASDMD